MSTLVRLNGTWPKNAGAQEWFLSAGVCPARASPEAFEIQRDFRQLAQVKSRALRNRFNSSIVHAPE